MPIRICLYPHDRSTTACYQQIGDNDDAISDELPQLPPPVTHRGSVLRRLWLPPSAGRPERAHCDCRIPIGAEFGWMARSLAAGHAQLFDASIVLRGAAASARNASPSSQARHLPSRAAGWPWRGGVVVVGGGLWLTLGRKGGSPVTTSTPRPKPTLPPQPEGTVLYTYRGHTGGINSLSWSPDGKRIASGAGGSDQTVQVWDAADGAHVLIYKGHTNKVEHVAWSPDGKRLASGGNDETVQIWDAPTGGHVFTYKGHTDSLYTVAWSPDSKRMASGGADKTVQLWDATTGGHLFTYKGHTDFVGSVLWSPDGKRIASASKDTTAQVWDAADGGHTYSKKATGPVTKAVWSLDGIRIASGGYDQIVPVWIA